jgi:hypothetical protein
MSLTTETFLDTDYIVLKLCIIVTFWCVIKGGVFSFFKEEGYMSYWQFSDHNNKKKHIYSYICL